MIEKVSDLREERNDYFFPRMMREPIRELSFRISRPVGETEKPDQYLSTIVVQRKAFFTGPTVEIEISEFVPLKKNYLRSLKRKSSRRWQKKWKKRGWVTEEDQIIKVGNKMIMSNKMHELILKQIQHSMSSMIEERSKEFFYGKQK